MIAIKMDMPQYCGKCPFVILTGWEVIYANCRISDVDLDRIEWTKERHKDCPLIPCIGIIRGYKEHKPKFFDFDDEVDE